MLWCGISFLGQQLSPVALLFVQGGGVVLASVRFALEISLDFRIGGLRNCIIILCNA